MKEIFAEKRNLCWYQFVTYQSEILQIVDNYVTYNLWKFRIDNIKIKA